MDKPYKPPIRLYDRIQAPLTPLLDRIQLHAGLLLQIRSHLPPHLAEHCRDCVAGGGRRLIVYADSPAWCFQLRFHGPAVLERMREFSGVRWQSLEFRSLPAQTEARRRDPGPPVSESTARMVMDSASGNASDELMEALGRLGRTLRVRANRGK